MHYPVAIIEFACSVFGKEFGCSVFRKEFATGEFLRALYKLDGPFDMQTYGQLNSEGVV